MPAREAISRRQTSWNQNGFGAPLKYGTSKNLTSSRLEVVELVLTETLRQEKQAHEKSPQESFPDVGAGRADPQRGATIASPASVGCGLVLHCAHSVAADAPAPRRWLHSGAAGARYRPLECRRANYPRVRAEELERGELLAAARRYYPSGAGRIGYQRCFRADGAGLKVAAAVGTGAAREPFDASWAPWAFKGADECLVSRRKVTVAAFAVGSNLEHGAILYLKIYQLLREPQPVR